MALAGHLRPRSRTAGRWCRSACRHTRRRDGTAPLAINHQGQFPVVTISFNLAPGVSLGDAVRAHRGNAQADIDLPASIQGSFQGTAQAFQASLANEPLLISGRAGHRLHRARRAVRELHPSDHDPLDAALGRRRRHPGAAALPHRLSVIALIGIILLIGIVKKNAIMMIDFALEAERNEGQAPRDAIYQACLLRFRPIMMTTMAALLGAVPLALGTGIGSELRRPLGITIIGGLIFSQVLTLYTTPVIYLRRSTAWRDVVRGRAPASNHLRSVHPPACRHDAADASAWRSPARLAFVLLPVSPLPQVDFPTIQVTAALPGASPETMASAVATPLERQFGRIAGVTEMTSTSYLGSTPHHAAVRPGPQHRRRRARRAGRHQRRARPAAGEPAEQSHVSQGQSGRCADHDPGAHLRHAYAAARCTTRPRPSCSRSCSQVTGVGQVTVGGGSLPGRARRGESDRAQPLLASASRTCARALRARQRQPAEGPAGRRRPALGDPHHRSAVHGRGVRAPDRRLSHGRAGAAGRRGHVDRFGRRLRNAGLANGKPAVLRRDLPAARRQHHRHGRPRPRICCRSCRRQSPGAIDLIVVLDQTDHSRVGARRRDARCVISVLLVILVVFVFLRNVRATFIPSVAVPVSLIGTFGVMYLLGYSLDNLSLMALTIATGFVVDDAIVVIENITRHLEEGMRPLRRRCAGRTRDRLHRAVDQRLAGGGVHSDSADGRHRGPTVPRVRGDAVGRDRRLLAGFADHHADDVRVAAEAGDEAAGHGCLYRASERVFDWLLRVYDTSLSWVAAASRSACWR